MAKSSVLLIGICSNHKDVQDDHPTHAYDRAGSLRDLLPPDKGKRLTELRQKAYSLLYRGIRGRRRDYGIGTHPDNVQLNGHGPDLGGSEPQANYLPAVQTYTGRFYAADALGSDRLDLVRRSHPHFLIVSGLYGLVNAIEHIQRYNLDLSDCEQIRQLWAGDCALTGLLVGYATRHKIQVVLDLTGLQSYRALVNWQFLEEIAGVDVLHAFCKHNAGDAALPTLGRLARPLLAMDEMAFLTLPDDGYDRILPLASETVMLTRRETPPDGYVTEDKKAEVLAGGCEGPEPPPPRPDLPVRSPGDDRTIFGRIDKMGDLPKDPRELFLNVSRPQHVTRVRFGAFTAKRIGECHLKLLRPTQGEGLIKGDLHWRGKLVGIQDVTILVERGHERRTWRSLLRVDDRIK